MLLEPLVQQLAAGAAAGAAPATSKTIINEPVLTLSPVAILISLTVPANGAGTSIEALSPSTVIKIAQLLLCHRL